MTITVPYSAQLSETWLLERTYHAQLRNGRELSVPDLTEAMEQLIDVSNPLSTQPLKSHLAERLPAKKSSNFFAPLSTWEEISQEEAGASYQRGVPVLLYGEHAWKHLQVASGIDYAVCYHDPQRGTFSNATWKAWFTSDVSRLFDGSLPNAISFLRPWIQFPYTTHYTVIASDGQVHQYADRAEAIRGFRTMPPREANNESGLQTVFPQFCYYDDVTFPDGVYRLEFFGPRMAEQGYRVEAKK